uniref:Glucagon / GIP / secretin / VIP family domain-containing protein n=1 Tax=Oncorhynchus tshawytscha TaxID=74940 RepID=A0AAZ3QXZ6_ONCTS
MARCHRATLVLLVCGILMHYRIYCSSIGLRYPKIRLENKVYEEEGNMLTDISFDNDQISIRSLPSLDDVYTLKYPTEKGEESRMEDESEPLSKRHSDGIFTDGYSRYRKQMAMKKYLEAVLGRRYRQRFRNKVWRLTYS